MSRARPPRIASVLPEQSRYALLSTAARYIDFGIGLITRGCLPAAHSIPTFKETRP